MKKIVSVLLACLMLICSVVPAFAEGEGEQLPLIVLGGYGSSPLYYYAEDGTTEQVWPLSFDRISDQTTKDVSAVVITLLKFLCGDVDDLGNAIAVGGMEILNKAFCGEDGSSLYDVRFFPNDPQYTNYNYLSENRTTELHEKELCAAQAKIRGGDRVFCFQYDFRKGGYEAAVNLDAYIKAVLEYTGAEKVDIFGISYGGFVGGTYLSLYADTAPVNNAVLDVPALGGTSFAKRFFLGEVEFPVSSLASLFETLLGSETNIAGLLKNVKLPRIEKLASVFLKTISVLPSRWGSLWDLLTPEDYEVLKAQLLDPVENAEIIRKSDIVHHVVMPNYKENFARCKSRGMKISILCNYVDYTAFGGDKLADMLLDASQVSGAVCTTVGNRFSDDYTPVGTSCSDSSHNHLAPSMKIDASSAYLPENTWFINGQYHGTYAKDPYTVELINLLLTAEDEVDIYTYESFPQFQIALQPYYSVNAVFKGETTGHVGNSDTLTVTNLSTKNEIRLVSIKMDGAKFDIPCERTLAPGDSVDIKVNFTQPITGYRELTVKYTKQTFGPIISERSFDFVK